MGEPEGARSRLHRLVRPTFPTFHLVLSRPPGFFGMEPGGTTCSPPAGCRSSPIFVIRTNRPIGDERRGGGRGGGGEATRDLQVRRQPLVLLFAHTSPSLPSLSFSAAVTSLSTTTFSTPATRSTSSPSDTSRTASPPSMSRSVSPALPSSSVDLLFSNVLPCR